jgi:4-diphosphocytidyl-2-C-methyl-D-erythritol kinase
MTTAVHSPIVAARVGIRADASRAARRAPRVQTRVPASRSATFSSFASPRRGALAVVAAAPADAAADEGSLATSFFSPSKVNLFLRIIRRREDGYHDLASLFHVIDLGDDMKFAKSSSKTRDTLVCSDDTIPLDESNLVIKALDLFRRKTGIEQYFWVELEKKVPHGAGLGGGSGNAATAMWAANVLCGAPATEEQLLEWSGDIGSDISVFFSTGAAYCTGRGEIVEDVEPPLPLTTPMLLVKPNVGLSTPQIFKALDLNGLSSEDPLALMEAIKKRGCADDVCVNDLEAPAFSELPELLELKNKLKEAGEKEGKVTAVFMSGSGSTIVQVGDDATPAFVEKDADLFKAKTRLITRKRGEWFAPSLEYK